MERYAPTLMELAPRDMVSRAIYQEIRAGRGHRRQGLRLPRRPAPRAQGDRREAARHHRLRPRLPGRRADHRAGPDPADRPLRDGRHPDRPARPGSPATRRAPWCPGCTRRASPPACQRPRREPAGDELAGRPAGVRPAGRAADGRGRQGRRHARRAPTTRRSPSGPRSRRSTGHKSARAAGQRSARDLADVMMDDVGRLPRRDGLRPGAAPGRASCATRYARVAVARQGQRLQHGPARGARARLPARLRRDDGRGRARPEGEPRRPRPRGLPRARRRRTSWPTRWRRRRDGAVRRSRYKPVTITKFQPKPRTY